MDQRSEGDVVTEQWLAKQDIVIPRASGLFESDSAWVKVDSNGVIVAASEKDKSLIAFFIARQMLKPCHAEYGFCFQEMRHAFLSRVTYKSNAVFLAQLFGRSVSQTDAESMYLTICTALGRPRVRLIQSVMENRATPSNTHLTRTEAAQCRAAFDHLIDAVENERAKQRV